MSKSSRLKYKADKRKEIERQFAANPSYRTTAPDPSAEEAAPSMTRTWHFDDLLVPENRLKPAPELPAVEPEPPAPSPRYMFVRDTTYRPISIRGAAFQSVDTGRTVRAKRRGPRVRASQVIVRVIGLGCIGAVIALIAYFIEAWSSLHSQGVSHSFMIVANMVGGGVVIPLVMALSALGYYLADSASSSGKGLGIMLLRGAGGLLFGYVASGVILMGWFALIAWLHGKL